MLFTAQFRERLSQDVGRSHNRNGKRQASERNGKFTLNQKKALFHILWSSYVYFQNAESGRPDRWAPASSNNNTWY
jgi:hypothetical protein